MIFTRQKINKKCFSLLLSVLVSCSAHAGIDSALKGLFDEMGTSGNLTRAGAYRDQSGGYYSGGSLFVRTPAHHVQFLQVTPPGFNMNCTNMDLVSGGFSVLSSDQLMKALHSIGRNAAAYALQLGLQTVAPQVKAAIDQLMAVLQNVNGLTQNSCTTGKILAAGLLPKNEAMMKDLCRSKGMSLKIMEDFAGMEQGCNTRTEEIATEKVAGYEDILAGEYNLAWKALQKNDFLKADPSLASLMMSVSGSILSRKSSATRFQKSHLPSLMSNQNLMDGLIYGGQNVEIYQCDDKAEDKCLNPVKIKAGLAANTSLFGRVQGVLESLSVKIRNDGEISKEEQAFVNSTSLPVMTILSIEGAFRSDGSPLKASEFAEAIAYDLLLRYFSSILDLLTENLRDLEKVQIDESIIKDFKEDLRHAQVALSGKRNGIYQQMLTQLKMIEHAQQIEGKLQSMFMSISQGDYL